MRRMLFRSVTSTVLAAALAGLVAAPAHAVPDQWVFQGRVQAPPAAGLAQAITSLIGAATNGACEPKLKGVQAYNLGTDTWLNPATGEVGYDHFNTGLAYTSQDCSGSAHVTVQLTDYAPMGRPPVVRGIPSSGDSPSPSGGRHTAVATARLWVVEYEPLSLYARGASLVETKVSGTYWNTSLRRDVTIACIVVYTQVTPTPAGPIYGETTEPGPCA